MLASIRDTSIFFDVDGAGVVADGRAFGDRPVALLVHGGPGVDHTGWKIRFPSLVERAQVVFFDHRGHGRSASGNLSRYTLDENVEDMEALRRYLGLGSIVSIGFSYGGMVAMAHAARYPDSVSHLILGATASHGGFIVRAKQLVASRGSEDQIRMFYRLLDGAVDTPDAMRIYFETMSSLYSRRPTTAETARSMDPIYSPEPLNVAFGPEGFLHAFDLRPELPKIRAETLIVAGQHDWICAPEFSEEIRSLIVSAELRIFANSGHMIGIDEPEKVRDLIFGFLIYRGRASVGQRHGEAVNFG